MVTVGIDAESSRRSAEIATDHDLSFSAGVHPNSAATWSAETAGLVEALLGNARAVAAGETGLDFYRDRCPPDVQRAAFREHIALARTQNVALIVHTRESVSEALDELESAGPVDRIVFHCWSGEAPELKRALGIGAFVSFAGNVSFKNAEHLRELARLVPKDRLLVETDSPFLAPVPHRGTPNEPALVVDVGRALAASLRIDAAELARMTADNAHMLFSR
jgi:TatD DNase family protein